MRLLTQRCDNDLVPDKATSPRLSTSLSNEGPGTKAWTRPRGPSQRPRNIWKDRRPARQDLHKGGNTEHMFRMYNESGELVGVEDRLVGNPLLPHKPLPERLGVTTGFLNARLSNTEVKVWEEANKISPGEVEDMMRLFNEDTEKMTGIPTDNILTQAQVVTLLRKYRHYDSKNKIKERRLCERIRRDLLDRHKLTVQEWFDGIQVKHGEHSSDLTTLMEEKEYDDTTTSVGLSPVSKKESEASKAGWGFTNLGKDEYKPVERVGMTELLKSMEALMSFEMPRPEDDDTRSQGSGRLGSKGDDRTNDADMGTGGGLDDGDDDSVNDDPCRDNESVRSSGLFGALHGLKSLGGFQRPSLEGPLRPRDVKRLFVFFNETQFNAFSAGAKGGEVPASQFEASFKRADRIAFEVRGTA